MAIHTTLPIYKDAYQLLDCVVSLAENMPRNFKPLIGQRLLDDSLEILDMVFRANSSRDKVQHLDNLLSRLQKVELLCRASKERRLISVGQYAKAIKLTNSIGRQAGGWRKKFQSGPVA